MKTYNIHEAKTHLSRLVEAAAAGEEIVIAKAGKPVAKLVAYAARTRPRPLGLLRGKIWEAPDAWDPDPELEELFYGGDVFPKPKPRRVAERKRKPK
jgi:prevent-host-death family protein